MFVTTYFAKQLNNLNIVKPVLDGVVVSSKNKFIIYVAPAEPLKHILSALCEHYIISTSSEGPSVIRKVSDWHLTINRSDISCSLQVKWVGNMFTGNVSTPSFHETSLVHLFLGDLV